MSASRAITIGVFVVVLLTTATGAVAATSTTPETTTDPSGNETSTDPTTEPTLHGDPDLHIVDYWMSDGTMHVELHAESAAFVTLSAPPTGDSDLAGGYVRQTRLFADETAVVTIRSPASVVWLSSGDSMENGRFTELDATGPGIIPGPFDSQDVLYGVLGGALGVAFPVTYRVINRYHGEPEQGERVA